MWLRLVGSFSIVVAMLSAGLTSAVPAHAASGSAAFYTFNLCGNACHRGSESHLPASVVRWISEASPQPFAVALQEACRNQAEQIANQTSYSMSFMATGPTCANGQPYGNAILYKGTPKSDPLTLMLPNPGHYEPRGIICVLISGMLDNVVVCSVHLDNSANPETRTQQIQAVDNLIADELLSQGTVFIGGDFNAPPKSVEMNPMYEGPLTEAAGDSACRCGAATHENGRKIDYLWMGDNRGGLAWDRSQTSTTADRAISDHYLLRGTVTW